MDCKKVLTIAGSDCSGGAGMQADLKTMTALGVYGMSVITALTAQNTMGVSEVAPVEPAFVRKQLEAVFSDIVPDAVKIGMLANSEIIEVIADFLENFPQVPVVLDPVMVSTSGHCLLEPIAKDTLERKLFPLAKVITPNLPEAEVLLGRKITTSQEMEQAAKDLFAKYHCSVLVKGGHCESKASDILYTDEKLYEFSGEVMDNPNKHGTGCTLSSAIASYLAKGHDLVASCEFGKQYVERALAMNLNLGKGKGPLWHLVSL